MVCPFRVVVFVVSLAVALVAAIYSFRRLNAPEDEFAYEDPDDCYGDARDEGEEEDKGKKAKKSWMRWAAELYTGKFLYDLWQGYKRAEKACPVVGEGSKASAASCPSTSKKCR